MSFNLESFKGVMPDGALEILQDPEADVRERLRVASHVKHNIDLTDDPSVVEMLKDREGYMPEYLMEDNKRRNRWDWCFQKDPRFKNGKNGAVRRATEVWLDNTLASILTEHLTDPKWRRMHPKKFFETITQSNITAFPRIALPMVRRALPDLLFDILFTIIPVTQPDVKIPFLKRKYGETHTGGGVDGDEVWPYHGSQYDPYFGGARKVGENIGTGDAIVTTFDLSYSPTYAHEVFLDGVLQTTGFSISVGTGPGGVDQVVFVAAPGVGVEVTASYDNRVEGTPGREMRLTVDLIDIDGDKMTLKSDYTFEAAERYRAFYQRSMRQDLPVMLREELAQMMDSISLNEVVQQANAGEQVFDATGFLPGDTTSSARNAYSQGLYKKMVAASQDLFDLHRIQPVWIVAGTGAAEALMNLETFNVQPGQNATQATIQQRTIQQGFIGNRWILYQNPKLPTNQMVFGWPSAFPFLVGYLITMYLPFFITPEIWNSSANLNRAQGAITWAGRKMIDDTQYSRLVINNLS